MFKGAVAVRTSYITISSGYCRYHPYDKFPAPAQEKCYQHQKSAESKHYPLSTSDVSHIGTPYHGQRFDRSILPMTMTFASYASCGWRIKRSHIPIITTKTKATTSRSLLSRVTSISAVCTYCARMTSTETRSPRNESVFTNRSG